MHSFSKNPIDASFLLEKPSLKEFVKRSKAIALTDEAKRFYEGHEYKDYSENDKWTPKYFGSAIEFLAEMFFDHYGAIYNLHNIKSTDDWDSTEVDLGIDHTAMSIQQKKYNGAILSGENTPIYIQTKGTLRSDKMFMANDGSRIPNFMSNAQSKARLGGYAYKTRYILFTTGKGLHYRLDEMTGNSIEVVNYSKISRRIDNDQVFFNKMRMACGIDPIDVTLGQKDGEAIWAENFS